MHLASILAILPIAGGLAASQAPRPSSSRHNATVIPHRYIVEVNSGEIDDITNRLKAQGAEVLRTFKSDVFSGLSIFWKNHTRQDVQELAGAVNTWNTKNYTVEAPVPSMIFKRDDYANYSFLPFVNADKVHLAGFTGSGVKIGVVDTGVDFNHPALGGCFGTGCKIAGGYDFVGDDYPATTAPDPIPNDQAGHGTHVTGIIAGKSDEFTGIAPDATIYSYKVFGATGGATGDNILAAFVAAYNQGCDIITASLGGGAGWPDDGLAELSARYMAAGVVVTVAAMNSGDDGPISISDTSAGKDVIAVASMDAPVVILPSGTVSSTIDGQTSSFGFSYFVANSQPAPLAIIAVWPVVPISLNTSDDAQACAPLPAGSAPSAPTIVLVKQAAQCDISTQMNNALAGGAFILLVYNNDSSLVKTPVVPSPRGNILAISKADGEAIVSAYAAGGSPVVDWSIRPGEGIPSISGGVPSEFTSWGPAYDLGTRPDVAAAGGNIFSTYLNEGWAVLSGTSMATPMMAGVAALYISAHGGRSVWGNQTAYRIKHRLVASGRSLPWQTLTPLGGTIPINYGAFAPVAQVGSGLVDAWSVVSTTTQLTFDNIALNDTAHLNGTWNVVVANTGTSTVTYNFTLEPAGGFNMQSALNPAYIASLPELVPKSYVPAVVLPKGTFSVAAGQQKTATFTFSPPTGVTASLLPIYNGKVVIQGSNGDKLSIPYLGAAFDLRAQISGNLYPPGFPKQISGPNRENIQQYHSYNFDLSPSVASYPNISLQLKYSVRELRWDIFSAHWTESEWKYPPAVGQNKYVGSATTYGDTSAGIFDPSTMNKESTSSFPFNHEMRTFYPSLKNAQQFMWFGKLANGSYIAPGTYIMRFAGLLPHGDPNLSSGWQVWQTPSLTILPYTP
ncbi:subtilisin-like serine protease [Thozetella sp. PMI_491]|nr:subtilisin-like serine protease [Thozetella sp. PMI_491]